MVIETRSDSVKPIDYRIIIVLDADVHTHIIIYTHVGLHIRASEHPTYAFDYRYA